MTHAKTALIIGASRGLGLGLVKRLTEQGWDVTATARDPQKAHELKAVDRVRIETLEMDDAQSLEALAHTLNDQVFDLLFVNAGIIGAPHQSAAKATAAELGELFLTNVTAPVRLAERFLGQIRKGTGVIAFMSSGLGSVTSPGAPEMALYKASKAALNSLTNTFFIQLPDDAPTVLSMNPGWVRTDMGGEGADLDVETSTSGMVEQVKAYAGKGGHYFIDYKGDTVPW